MAQITRSVPRSGCSAISTTATKPTPITGPATVLSERAIFGRAAITAAVCRTSASFMISLGWNWSGPAPSQRRAPLTRTPMPGILTRISITNAAISSAAVKRRTYSRSRREMTYIAISPTAP